MIDDISDITEFYDRDPDFENERLTRHQLEHDLTWRYLDRFLPKGGSILEIGAATGKYTLELARRGYRVTAMDLSANMLEKCRLRLSAAGLEKKVHYIVGDARDLDMVHGEEFEAVLLMGPLYHLVVEEDRKMALRQSYLHLAKGGIIFSTWISRYGILGDLLKNSPDWIEHQSEVRGILEQGRDPEGHTEISFRGYFATVPEIATLHEEIGYETFVLAGIEPAISADDYSYNRLEGKQRQMWLDLLYEVSTEETIMAASRHLLYVGRKP